MYNGKTNGNSKTKVASNFKTKKKPAPKAETKLGKFGREVKKMANM